MPPRKRSRRLAFRTGNINAAGGKPIDPQVITHRSVVAAQFMTSGTTSGDHGVFQINAWNTPLLMVSNTAWTVPVGISASRHPSGHVELLADGYNAFLVEKTHYRIDVAWLGGSLADSNWIFAYKFDNEAQSALPIFTAGATTTETWLDIQASPGWIWKRFGCTPTAQRKSYGTINIDIPNVVQQIYAHERALNTQFTIDDLKGLVLDATTAPTVVGLLHVCAFAIKKDGVVDALAAFDIMMNVRCTQTVKVWKNQESEEIIDAGDDV